MSADGSALMACAILRPCLGTEDGKMYMNNSYQNKWPNCPPLPWCQPNDWRAPNHKDTKPQPFPFIKPNYPPHGYVVPNDHGGKWKPYQMDSYNCPPHFYKKCDIDWFTPNQSKPSWFFNPMPARF
jgi:hypothetical protein